MFNKTDGIIFIASVVAIILFIYLGYIAEERIDKKARRDKIQIALFILVLVLCFVAIEFFTKIICSMSHEQLRHLILYLAVPIAFVISQLYSKFKKKNKEIDELKLLLHNACFDIDLYNKKSKEITERIAELKKRDITKAEMKFLDYVQREIDYISCPDSDYTHLPGKIHYLNNFHSRSTDLCDAAVQHYKNFNTENNEVHKLCYDVMQILTESSLRKEYYKENYKPQPLDSIFTTSDYDPWRYCRNLLDKLNP